jgi:hypothetical protein
MVAQILLNPYSTRSLNVTQSTALLANTLTLFVGLMLIIDVSLQAEAKLAGEENFDTTGRSVISAIVVLVNFAVLAIPTTISVLQSGYFYKALSFFSCKKKDKLDIDDSESDKLGIEDPESDKVGIEDPESDELGIDDPELNGADPHIRSDTLSQPVSLPIQAEFSLPSRLTVLNEEHSSSSCSIAISPWTSNLVHPARESAISEEVHSFKAVDLQEPPYPKSTGTSLNLKAIDRASTQVAGRAKMQSMIYSSGVDSNPQENVASDHGATGTQSHGARTTPNSIDRIDCDTRLCFVSYPEGNYKELLISASGSVTWRGEQNIPATDTNQGCCHQLEAGSDSTLFQMPTLELDPHHGSASSHWSGDSDEEYAIGQAGTSESFLPDMFLQQVAIEAIGLTAEGLAEMQEIPASQGTYF